MFSEIFNPAAIETLVHSSQNTTDADLIRVLTKPQITLDDLPALLSPIAQNYIETIANRSHQLTIQRFGKTMQLFIPMYISNVCYNNCTYCGFSMDYDYKRITLNTEEILAEARYIKSRGFDHILILTGEADKSSIGYIAEAIATIRPLFSSIGIEIQPLNSDDYTKMVSAGCNSLTVYQETYHPDAYAIYHTKGKKRNFTYRLDTPDRAGDTGFHTINIGALMGLYKWQFEALALAQHLQYLQKKYWKVKYAVSFPRIQDMVGEFTLQDTVSDMALVQLICAFRLVFPDIGITLSTREKADLRDHLFKLGITTISAESKTAPGAYTKHHHTEPQFEISDHRSLNEVIATLKLQGYDPVFKDFDRQLA